MADGAPEELQALAGLIDVGEEPLDIPTFLEDVEAEQSPEPAVRDDEPLPGDEDAEQFTLSKNEEAAFAHEICEKLDLYDTKMTRRHNREEEIENAYNMISDPRHSGDDPDAAQMVSEMMMSMVDQSAARIEAGLLGVEPLFRVDPIQGEGEELEEATDRGRSAERFLNNYLIRGMRFDRKLPVATHQTCKVGTQVLYCMWDTKRERVFSYDKEGNQVSDFEEKGFIGIQLIPNQDAVVWPTDLIDWQDGYEFVGHRAFYSHTEWKVKARELGLSGEEIESIESDNPRDEAGDQQANFANMDSAESALPDEEPVMLTELWCNMFIPGRDEREKFQVILHEPTRKVLYVGPNLLHSQKHPYFPLRYKMKAGSAWGDGIGHELIQNQAADSAFKNLEMDNLMAGAYSVVLTKAGSLGDQLTDRLRPGMRIPVDSTSREEPDLRPEKLGGEAQEVRSARQDNQFSARQATGASPVLSGQGDPTMKSGAGTGSTLALIEQASTKFEQVARRIKIDLSELAQHILELVFQYGPEGVLYHYATEEDASILRTMRYTPDRGRVGELYHIWAQAPSPAASNEARKQNYLVVWKFALEHLQILEAKAGEILMQENPEAFQRMKRQIVSFMNEMARRVIETHDLPGLKEQIPDMPEPLPADDVINQLNQVIQQQQQQLQQMEMAFQGGPQGMLGGGQGPEGMMGPQGGGPGGMMG